MCLRILKETLQHKNLLFYIVRARSANNRTSVCLSRNKVAGAIIIRRANPNAFTTLQSRLITDICAIVCN